MKKKKNKNTPIETGKLDRACCYLSGAMEFVADHGVGWRRDFIDLIKQKKLKIDFIDPTNKPGGEEIRIGENKEHQETLQKEGKWKELKNYVHSYRRYDLRFVDYSDFLVVAINHTVPQWGTANEVYFAEAQHKPIFFICEGGLYKMPRWLIDVVDIDDEIKGTRCNVFENVEDLVDELVKIDNGEVPMSDKWVLVRKFIEQDREDLPLELIEKVAAMLDSLGDAKKSKANLIKFLAKSL